MSNEPLSPPPANDSLLCVVCGFPPSMHTDLRMHHNFQPFHDASPAVSVPRENPSMTLQEMDAAVIRTARRMAEQRAALASGQSELERLRAENAGLRTECLRLREDAARVRAAVQAQMEAVILAAARSSRPENPET
jgi:hypothetical protein